MFYMKKPAILSMLLLTTITATAAAQPTGFSDVAQVISTQPVYQQVTTQNCQMEQTQMQPQQSSGIGYTGAILGALAGGLLGNTVGQGNGRIAATAVGAATGGLVGSNMQNNQQPQYSQRQVCNPVINQQLVGYSVTYSYAGHQATTMMQQQPGATIPINVVPAAY